MVVESVPEWSFIYSDHWVPSRVPDADENLLRAVETMALSLLGDSSVAERVLDFWRKSLNGGEGAGVNMTTVAIRITGDGAAEMRDKYGQFENVQLPTGEVTSILDSLIKAIKSRSG